MKPSFFTVSRKLIESDLWLSKKFTEGQAWVDLIGMANWNDSTAKIRGIRFNVKRGQVARSEYFLAKRWKWSRGKVRRFINDLKNEHRIVPQKSKLTTLINIVNYDQYQLDSTTNDTTNGTTNGTKKGEQKNKITRGKSALELFAPEINGWNNDEFEKTVDGFISIRKTKEISSGVLEKELEYWHKYSDDVVNISLKTYNDKKYWKSGKGEKYLRGIIRGKDSEIKKQNSKSLLEKAY